MPHQIERLTVHAFRQSKALELEKLGRINLFVGVNNSGKTSVLKAISTHCNPLNPLEWINTARRRYVKSSREPELDAVRWLFHNTTPITKTRKIEAKFESKVTADTRILNRGPITTALWVRLMKLRADRTTATTKTHLTTSLKKRPSHILVPERTEAPRFDYGDLQKRVPVPLFLQNNSHSVAIHSAIGDTRLVRSVEESAALIEVGDVTGIGLILDSDQQVPAADRYGTIKAGLRDKGLTLPENAGDVAEGPPRLGAYVLPDNYSPGTREDLLIECAHRPPPIY